MNKLLLSITLVFSVLALFSQDKNIELMKGKVEDAKIQVDQNILNQEKNTKAETWYLAAYVYTRMAKSEVYEHLEKFPGEKALSYIKESKKLDKTGVLYSEQINVLLDLGPAFYNKAITHYNKAVKDSIVEEFTLSLRYFEDYFDLLDLLKDEDKFVKQIIEYNGINHNDVYFYAGYSAQSIGEINKAIKYYSMLNDFNSDKTTAKAKSKDLAYLYLTKIYTNQGDYVNALKVVKRGVELYPDNEALVLQAITTYKNADKMDDMVAQMEQVVVENPQNEKLLFILASNYSKYGKAFEKNNYQSTADMYFEKSIKYYEQALKIDQLSDQTKYSINYNLGVLYYNRGVSEYKKADNANLELLQKYFSSAKPLLENAKKYKANPNIDKMIENIDSTLGE
ncbi:MAG: hypothetical protein JXR60_00975 [Bacteroidales bacterium]|nr:hypothetical protein [Bacteroidales bacterium]